MTTTWKTKYGPRRVKHDPPTLEEAIFAARGLTDDVDAQVEIAAGLMEAEPDDGARAAEEDARRRARRRRRSPSPAAAAPSAPWWSSASRRAACRRAPDAAPHVRLSGFAARGHPVRLLLDRTSRRDRMPEVYVHAVEGRTPEQKRALMKDITDAVVKNFNARARGGRGDDRGVAQDQQGEGRRAVQRAVASFAVSAKRPAISS